MHKRQQKSHYGNKAIIFTLDMFVAITVFIIILTVCIFYISQMSQDRLSELQLVSLGSDTIAVMDYSGVLQSLDVSQIISTRDQLIPSAYNMRILVKLGNLSADTGNLPPAGIFLGSGKRYFVSGLNYGEADYWIWVKV